MMLSAISVQFITGMRRVGFASEMGIMLISLWLLCSEVRPNSSGLLYLIIGAVRLGVSVNVGVTVDVDVGVGPINVRVKTSLA